MIIASIVRFEVVFGTGVNFGVVINIFMIIIKHELFEFNIFWTGGVVFVTFKAPFPSLSAAVQ